MVIEGPPQLLELAERAKLGTHTALTNIIILPQHREWHRLAHLSGTLLAFFTKRLLGQTNFLNTSFISFLIQGNLMLAWMQTTVVIPMVSLVEPGATQQTRTRDMNIVAFQKCAQLRQVRLQNFSYLHKH